MASPSVESRILETPKAVAYAKNVWYETYYRRKLEVLPLLRDTITGSLGKPRSDREKEELQIWEAAVSKIVKDSSARQIDLITGGIQIANEYRTARASLGVRERPRYNIDPTLPTAVLNIQAEMDIHREARHLNSTLYSDEEIEMHRNVAGCCIFNKCKHITDEISHQKEKDRINELDVAALEEGSWVTASIATLAGVSRQGRPLVGFDWAFAKHLHGYDKAPTKQEARVEAEFRRKPSPELSPRHDAEDELDSDPSKLSPSPDTTALLRATEDKEQSTSMAAIGSGKSEGVGRGSSLKRAADQLSRDQVADILSRPDLGLSFSELPSSSSLLNLHTTPGPSNTKLPEVTSPEVSRTQQSAAPNPPTPGMSSVSSSTAQYIVLADGPCNYCGIFDLECDRVSPKCKQCVGTGRNCKWPVDRV